MSVMKQEKGGKQCIIKESWSEDMEGVTLGGDL